MLKILDKNGRTKYVLEDDAEIIIVDADKSVDKKEEEEVHEDESKSIKTKSP